MAYCTLAELEEEAKPRIDRQVVFAAVVVDGVPSTYSMTGMERRRRSCRIEQRAMLGCSSAARICRSCRNRCSTTRRRRRGEPV